MLDQILTYLVVLCAAAFVIWKLFLPLRYKTMIAHAASGKTAPCAPEPETGLCGTGCAGCALASRPAATASPGGRTRSSREPGRR